MVWYSNALSSQIVMKLWRLRRRISSVDSAAFGRGGKGGI
jgi:hypothetical protein